ncbi:transketolase family protein [Candidatus Collierbacteria bacterium]|nr:transketolase family protein [Candidatus Collierbacteria bacterium]
MKSNDMKATRDGFGEALVELGKTDRQVVVLTADLGESLKVTDFAKQFPDRFIQVGVAEQNMAGIAAGLAAEGFIPFITSFAVFNPGRNWEQIRASICYANLNVKIIGGHSGLSNGPDGATHQGLEDIALARVLPNMTVLVPADYNQARAATLAAAENKGPIYIRLTREKTPVFCHRDIPFRIGKAEILKEGTDVTIVACGPLVYEAIKAAEALQNGYNGLNGLNGYKDKLRASSHFDHSSHSNHFSSPLSAEVINVSTIKPLDVQTIVKSARKTGRVVTVEEHQITGGLGGAVAEVLSEFCPVPIKRVGMKDCFGESGEAGELLERYEMTAENIFKSVLEVVK